MNRKIVVFSLFSVALALSLSGCDKRPNAEIPPAQASADSFKVAGDYELHYNAVRTDQLTPEVARVYDIERSKNKVLLNISVLHKVAGGVTAATDAEITVNAHNLNGQVKEVQLRRISESTAIYYIAEVSVTGAETLVFQINATPAGSASAIDASFTREFFTD